MKTKPQLPPLDLLQRYSIDEAAAYLRIGRSTLFEQIGKGSIQTLKEGGRTFVPGAEIARLSSPAVALARD